MAYPFADALIMAAGRGNRMRPLTDTLPKAMAPYKGDTLVGNSLKMLRERVDRVHITVGYKSAMLAEHALALGINSIFNTDGQTNSWWIHNTIMRHVDGPVIVLTCDNIVDLDFQLLAADYAQAGSPACMVVPVPPIPGLEGDFIWHQEGLVTRLSRSDRSDMYCSGIQVMNPARTRSLTENGGDFYSIWAQLIERGQLRVSSAYPKKWFTVDTLEQLLNLDERS